MTDMLERGARVLVETTALDSHAECKGAFSRALLAALDPEDEKLVEQVAQAIGLAEWYGEKPMPTPSETALRATNERLDHFAFHARAAIASLKQFAQGEQS